MDKAVFVEKIMSYSYMPDKCSMLQVCSYCIDVHFAYNVVWLL